MKLEIISLELLRVEQLTPVTTTREEGPAWKIAKR